MSPEPDTGSPTSAIYRDSRDVGLIGRRLQWDIPDGPFLEVVGVAADGKYRLLTESPRPHIFLPIGLTAAFLSSNVVSILLFGISPTDPIVFVGVLALVAAVASYIPARRALRIDPLAALRQE